jgi:hypothetical protein
VSLLQDQNTKKANPSQLYLEYFPLYAMFHRHPTLSTHHQNSFLEYQLPQYHFAHWLSMKYHLLWLGGGSEGMRSEDQFDSIDPNKQQQQPSSVPISRLHYDRMENLMTMVKGKKKFYLYGPDQSVALYGGTPMIQASFQAMRRKNEIKYNRDRSTVQMQPNVYHTYSPVNVRYPNFTKYPLLKKVKGMICEIEEGETLYLPSHWWHEVIISTRPLCL